MRRPGGRTALILCVGILLYAGLSPFDWLRRNGVELDVARGGLTFDGTGIVFSENAIEFPVGSAELTIEAWLVPAPAEQLREGTILALYDASSVAPIALSERRDALSLRYRIGADAGTQTRALSAPATFRPGKLHHVAVTSGLRGTRVYIDGSSPDLLRARDALIDPAVGLRARLVLGNAAQGFAGWSGALKGVAIRASVLPESEVARHSELVHADQLRSLASDEDLLALYVFDTGPEESRPRDFMNLALAAVKGRVPEPPAHVFAGALRVPTRFEVLRWDVLSYPPPVSPLRSSRFRQDILLNLFGFVPLGLLLMWYLESSPRCVGLSRLQLFAACLFVGTMLSLGIELCQAVLPTRISSVLDLFLNTLGTGLGAVLVLWWPRPRSIGAGSNSAGSNGADSNGRPHPPSPTE